MRFFQGIFLAMVLLGVGACSTDERLVITLPNQEELRVEVAITPEDQARGLMGRTELGEREGMLFVYPTPRWMTYWMKDTLIPLDILFIDANQVIVDIQTMPPCTEEPCPTYPSRANAQYALELNAGSAQEWGLKVGDALSFSLPHAEPNK